MQRIQQKAGILREALPYIQKYSGRIFVIKYGGNAMIDDEIKKYYDMSTPKNYLFRFKK